MKAYFNLFRRFILRAMARARLRSAITALGISLGVAVMVAIRIANTSALESFREATRSIAGETSIQVAGTAGRFDETLLGGLRWLRQYGQISPVIDGYAMTDDGAGAGEYLRVLGVDILRDRSMRRYQLLRLGEGAGEATTREFLKLLTDPEAIILTEKFARRHSLSIGSPVPLVIGDIPRRFVVRGLLADEGPARALEGNFALMDIAAAQLAFNRLGLLDRVDVKLKPGVAVEQAEAEIAARLPAQLRLSRPEAGYGQVEKMIAAFHFNLNALGSIAMLVGLFLIYNTISISVITRRGEIGILRALGAGRRMVLSLFLGEALLFALAGAGLGLLLGRLMANAAVRATATTVETFYIASTATSTLASRPINVYDIVMAFAVALPLALVAAAAPALEAARVRPVEAMRGAERLASGFRPSRRYAVASVALFATGYALSLAGPVNGLPVFGYLAALALMFGGAMLVPNSLWLACRVSGRLLGRVFRALQVEAMLASSNLLGAIDRVSISVAALAVSLAMMVAISIMIESFRETVSYWVDQTLKADIYARAVTRASTTSEGEIREEALSRIKAHPRVAAVDSYRSQQIGYNGSLITLGAGEFGVLLEHGRLMFKAPADARARMRGAIGRDAVVVSESLSLRHEKRPGDAIELATSDGPRSFEVAAVYYDYSSNRGRVMMDAETYSRHFGDTRPSSLSIYLEPGASAEEVSRELAADTADRYRLIFSTNGAVRSEVIRIFDSTFAITYALEVIAIVVAGMGVVSTLITLILERRGEIAVLSFLGATRAQVRRMVVIEAVLIGAVSQGVGILIGVLLSFVLIYVINVQSFGWTIQFHFPILFVAQSTLLIVAVTTIAGLYPAARAARVEAVQFAREE